MNQFRVDVAKKVVATVEMNYDEFKSLFKCSNQLVGWFKKEHPEYANCRHNVKFDDDRVVVELLSLGDPVINQIAIEI